MTCYLVPVIGAGTDQDPRRPGFAADKPGRGKKKPKPVEQVGNPKWSCRRDQGDTMIVESDEVLDFPVAEL